MTSCKNCNQPVSGRQRKYCSHQCREDFHNRDWRSKRPPRQREGDYALVAPRAPVRCPTCSEGFYRTSPRQKYCSRECRPKRQAKAKITRTCSECSVEFETTEGRDRKTCSNRCNMRRRYRENPLLVAQKVRDWEQANRDVHRLRQGERTDRRRRNLQGRGTISSRDWRRMLRRYRGCCAYCGQKAELTLDHVVPISRGGSNTIGNALPACPSCNYQKCDRTIMEWRLWKENR